MEEVFTMLAPEEVPDDVTTEGSTPESNTDTTGETGGGVGGYIEELKNKQKVHKIKGAGLGVLTED
jgi:hypothetical protein